MPDKEINILISSAGRRNNLIRYFKEEIGTRGKIYAGDMSSLAAAIHYADGFIEMPPCNDPYYFSKLKETCEKYNICSVIALTDTELTELAKYTSELEKIGVTVVGSPYKTAECCFDKLFLYRFCERYGYHAPRTYLGYDSFKSAYDMGEIDFPVYIKPRTGSASIDNTVANTMEEVILQCILRSDLLIQEKLEGLEIGIDIYRDLISGEIISIFSKDKISMRSGETEKAVSAHHEGLFEMISEFTLAMDIRGVVDIDLFVTSSGYHIIDVNPRFGGGYPLAYECGCNFPEYIINNLSGKENTPVVGDYEDGIYMLKCESLVISKDIMR